MSPRGLVMMMTVLVAGCSHGAPALPAAAGAEVGDAALPFNVKDCTGPAAGSTLCYR